MVPLLSADPEQKAWRTILSKFQIPKRHHDGVISAHLADPIGVSEEGVNGYGIYNATTRWNSHGYRSTDYFTQEESQSLMAAAYPLLTM